MTDLSNKKIGVLMGGFSSEREISLRSGHEVLKAFERLGIEAIKVDPAQSPIVSGMMDLAFNVLHGAYGEDGTIQSLLELNKIPYTGSGPAASMIAMNKLATKTVLNQHQLPTPAYQVYLPEDQNFTLSLSLPVVLKPLNQGSSVGVYIAHSQKEFNKYASFVHHSFGTCLVESFIKGKEVTVGLLGDQDQTQALPVLELRSKNSFYDFEAKYTKGLTEFILPAELPDETLTLCQNVSKTLHKLLDCRGMSRVDLCVNDHNEPYILEINTLPGLTQTSDLPAQAQAMNMDFETLVMTICKSAVERFS